MNSREISRSIGQSPIKRTLAYLIIRLTTLWEWYIRRGLFDILATYGDSFSFLDAGSGMGQRAIEVSKKYPGSRVSAIELDSEQVRDCTLFVQKIGKNNIRFIHGDLSDLNEKERFDVVLCAHILEHIVDDVGVLRMLYRAIKCDGYLLVYVPTSEQRVLPSLGRTIYKMTKRAKAVYPHDHVRYYTSHELSKKLKLTGFEVEKAIVTYGPYGRLAYDIVTSIQYCPIFKIAFPFYFILIHPFVLLLMLADFNKSNHEGNGLMITAIKRSV